MCFFLLLIDDDLEVGLPKMCFFSLLASILLDGTKSFVVIISIV